MPARNRQRSRASAAASPTRVVAETTTTSHTSPRGVTTNRTTTSPRAVGPQFEGVARRDRKGDLGPPVEVLGIPGAPVIGQPAPPLPAPGRHSREILAQIRPEAGSRRGISMVTPSRGPLVGRSGSRAYPSFGFGWAGPGRSPARRDRPAGGGGATIVTRSQDSAGGGSSTLTGRPAACRRAGRKNNPACRRVEADRPATRRRDRGIV